MLLGIKWHQFVWNDDVWRLTKQPKLTAIIKLRRLTLFGHIVRMDDYAGAKRILLASSPPADWRRQLPASRGWAPSNTSETPQPYTPQSSGYGSEPPSVEDAVDVWRYAILKLHARNDDDVITGAVDCLERLFSDSGLLCVECDIKLFRDWLIVGHSWW